MAGLLAAQIVALVAGIGLMLALGWWRLPPGLLVPTAWLAGTGALAAERLLLAQAGFGWNHFSLTLPWVPVALLAGRRLRDAWLRSLAPSIRDRWSRLAGSSNERRALIVEVAVAILIVVWTATLIRDTLAQPFTGWDAEIIWIFKGRVLYDTGTVPPAFFTDPHYAAASHLDYPLLVPLTVERIYEWTGDREAIVRAWWAMLAGAAAAGLYFGLAGLVGRVARLAGVALLLGMPAMQIYGSGPLTGYAELPLAIFFLYGALFLYRWMCTQQAAMQVQEFGLAAFFFGMAGFTKNEGMVITLAGFVMLVALALILRRFNSGQTILAVSLAALFVLPWQVEKWVLGITGDLQPTLSGIIENWGARIHQIAINLAYYASDTSVLGLVWPVLPLLSAACLILVARRWPATVPLLLLVAAHVAGTIAAYLTTPYDLTWHLGTSASRLVFQPVPVIALVSTIYVGQLLDVAVPSYIRKSVRAPSVLLQLIRYSER